MHLSNMQLKLLTILRNFSRIHILKRNISTKTNESFITGTSGTYIEDMYNAWLKDPTSVHASWDSYFRNSAEGNGYQAPPTLAPLGKNEVALSKFVQSASAPTAAMNNLDITKELEDHLSVNAVIRAYQVRGHMLARTDPLGIMYDDQLSYAEIYGVAPSVIMQDHNLSKTDLNREFILPDSTYIGGSENRLTLKDIMKKMEGIYAGHIGCEYMYMTNLQHIRWIRKHLETEGIMNISKEQKILILQRLLRASEFEAFLARKWSSEKRFGLEGCETIIPALKQIIDVAADLGVESFIIGMPHRGRLNVLANVCRKSLEDIFTQFATLQPTDVGSGDVKYHLGTSVKRLNRVANKIITVSVVANPSHLEYVGPVVQGKTRAEQFYKGDFKGKKVMSILMHGDASFCGQGIVFETMHLSDLPDYTTHGTIHIVLNNQIGFTTDPRQSRSSLYCTDVARVVNAPIFHVNSDHPERVIHACNVAAEWRATFRKDVVIDLVGYRRNGHNEIDEPMFTQPIMYQKIRKLNPIFAKYSAKLIKEGIVTEQQVKEMIKEYASICESGFEAASKQKTVKFMDWLDSPWTGFFQSKDQTKIAPTGIKLKTIQHICTKFSTPPPAALEFEMHKGIERILNGRMQMTQNEIIDWSLGEALAIGSLVKEGIHVRLSGQDVERGTFSHRHHVLHHQKIDKTTYRPLSNLYPDQAIYTVCNSSLSEAGVLGFEVGFALTNPNALIIWEGQFGDFVNSAQCIIDQFLSCGQAKWVRQCGIVVLLPHGLEGMGPEHSSCRLERFLQMSDDDPDVMPPNSPDFVIKQLNETNWIVANCTTPANIFHILRRQVYLPFRKPLILLSPKSLLRHPLARSPFSEILEGTEFRRVIPDTETAKNPGEVKKLIFCTGKVYYDFLAARDEKKLTNQIALVRMEQITPFPYDLVKEQCALYPNAEIVWGQEEHKNQGAYYYVRFRIKTAIARAREVSYVGRAVAASPSTGSKSIYKHEYKKLLEHAIKIH